MVLAYAGGYELIVPLVMLVGLLNHHHARWRPQTGRRAPGGGRSPRAC
jgi:hypothetical protein